ncbi:MAG: hypothetical protein M1608_17395 [Candidatus Omnitrophica bacterium]|nr:hypothetical protein [Candidatus Omnitrophota bacterium]
MTRDPQEAASAFPGADFALDCQGLLEYQIKCDEWDREKLKLILGGEDATDMTQSAKNLQVCDAWDFATTPAVIDRWYDVLMSGYQIRDITKICIPKSAAVACTVDPDTDFITAAGHGLSNGTPIYLIADVIPTGATQYEKYYVINATTNTFQIATAFFAGGGAATDFTTSGTTVKYTELLVENTDYVLDAKIGRVRFAAAQAASTTAVVSATIINAGDAASMKAMTPLSQIIRQGFGRLAIFDDQHDNNVVYLHEGFSCEILMESAGDMDGKTIPELTLTVRVTDTVGTIYTAE